MLFFKVLWPLFFLTLVIGEKILVLHPVYAGSHVHALRSLLEELLHRGHQVRVLRWLESSKIPPIETPDYNETILSVNNLDGSIPFLTKEKNAVFQFPSKHMWERGLNPLSVFDGGMSAVAASCNALFQRKSLIEELKIENYQLAIVDVIYNECSLALAHHLGLPVVGYWGLFFMSCETQYMAAFNPPSVIPNIYLPFGGKMNFFQRVINFTFSIFNHIVIQFHFSYTDSVIQKYLPGTPSSSVLLGNFSGMLINSHSTFDFPKQLPPSFFQIGGFHIKDHRSVQGKLLEFVENATEGVILFSLGMNFDLESMPSEVFNSYFRAFGKLKQKVVVKSNSNPDKVPPNVMIMSRVPQADVLAHPNTVLFITHCGMHGVMEAIHYGIKMVGIPMFFDQGNVAARLKEKKVAVVLSKQAKTDDIYNAIQTVLNDNSYQRNIKQLSSLYHHSLDNSMTRAVWLVEHVLESEGAPHLKLDSKNFNFFQYFCIDVVIFLSLLAIILIILTIKTFYYFFTISEKKHKIN